MTDITKHDKALHTDGYPIPKHTPKWYELFGDKCPTCGAPAQHK